MIAQGGEKGRMRCQSPICEQSKLCQPAHLIEMSVKNWSKVHNLFTFTCAFKRPGVPIALLIKQLLIVILLVEIVIVVPLVLSLGRDRKGRTQVRKLLASRSTLLLRDYVNVQ